VAVLAGGFNWIYPNSHQKYVNEIIETAEESEVLSLIHKKGEIPLDEIAWQLQKNMGQLATILLNLEFQGVLKALPGHRYVIK